MCISRGKHLCWATATRVRGPQHYWRPTWLMRRRTEEAWQLVHSHEGKQHIACNVKQEPTHHGFEPAQACIRNVPVERKKPKAKLAHSSNQNNDLSQWSTLMILVNTLKCQQVTLITISIYTKQSSIPRLPLTCSQGHLQLEVLHKLVTSHFFV